MTRFWIGAHRDEVILKNTWKQPNISNEQPRTGKAHKRKNIKTPVSDRQTFKPVATTSSAGGTPVPLLMK
jgi:hypothetical protein